MHLACVQGFFFLFETCPSTDDDALFKRSHGSTNYIFMSKSYYSHFRIYVRMYFLQYIISKKHIKFLQKSTGYSRT